MAITNSDLALAEARMRRRMKGGLRAIAARYDRRLALMIAKLETGVEFRFPPRLAEGLADARPDQMNPIEISPSGLGLHFPKLDADLYVPALLDDIFGSRNWMAAALGKAGGSRSTSAKAEAARANGRLGGRPRKDGGSTAQATRRPPPSKAG